MNKKIALIASLVSLSFNAPVALAADSDVEKKDICAECFTKVDIGKANPTDVNGLFEEFSTADNPDTDKIHKGGGQLLIVDPAPAIPVYFVSNDVAKGLFRKLPSATGNFDKTVPVASLDKMVNDAKAYLASHPNSKLIVFVHGCCQDHRSAYSGAAELARDTGWPVLLYSWSSSPYKFSGIAGTIANHGGYSENEANIEISQTAFDSFLDQFEQKMAAAGVLDRVDVIAHSMGNRLVSSHLGSATPLASSPAKFDSIIFACADVPVQAFNNRKGNVVTKANNTFVLVNNRDKALRLSTAVHGVNRLGNPEIHVAGVRGNGVLVVDMETIQQSEHAMPCKIIAALLKSVPSPEFKLTSQPNNTLLVERVGPVTMKP